MQPASECDLILDDNHNGEAALDPELDLNLIGRDQIQSQVQTELGEPESRPRANSEKKHCRPKRAETIRAMFRSRIHQPGAAAELGYRNRFRNSDNHNDSKSAAAAGSEADLDSKTKKNTQAKSKSSSRNTKGAVTSTSIINSSATSRYESRVLPCAEQMVIEAAEDMVLDAITSSKYDLVVISAGVDTTELSLHEHNSIQRNAHVGVAKRNMTTVRFRYSKGIIIIL